MTGIGRITNGLSTLLNPFGPSWPSSAEQVNEARPVSDQVQDALFGKKKPNELDPEDFEDAAKTLKILDRFRRKFVLMLGDSEEDYRLQLAEGNLAMIDSYGTIYLGLAFLRQYRDQMPVLLGALAHEIGHRPQSWNEYKELSAFTKDDLDALCRYEETRADLFAGRALAEVSQSVEPMIAFLLSVEEGPHPEYYPAKMRAEVIREGFREQTSFAATRKRSWPELDRATSAKMHVGEF